MASKPEAPEQVADAASADKTFTVDGYQYGLQSVDDGGPNTVNLVSPRGNVIDSFASEKDARAAAADPASPARLAQNRVG